MRRTLAVAAVLAVLGVAAGFVYQAAARERDYRALIARGDAALHDDQTFGAIEAYSGAIALHPDSMLAHLRRGDTYRRRGELAEAARDFRTAAALDSTATRPLEALGDVLYQLQRFNRAAEIYARDLTLDDRSPTVSYKLALARFRLGDTEGAISTLRTALRLNDRLADAQYLLGLCLRRQQQDDEAIAAFERAVEIEPTLVAAREELADLFTAEGRHTDAIAQLQAIATLDRGHIERQVALGLAQARAGEEELAVLTLGSALEGTSDPPLVYTALGRVWLDRAQAHNDPVFLSKALEALARVAANPNATSDVLTLYGRALLMAHQFDMAEQTLEQASTRYPLDPASLVLYSTAAEQQSHFDLSRQALIDYTTLVPADAELVPHAMRIAALSLRLRDTATAVTWLRRAADAAPDDVHVLGALADAELRVGDARAASAAIARGLAKEPADPTLLRLQRRIHPSGRGTD